MDSILFCGYVYIEHPNRDAIRKQIQVEIAHMGGVSSWSRKHCLLWIWNIPQSGTSQVKSLVNKRLHSESIDSVFSFCEIPQGSAVSKAKSSGLE